VLKTRITYFGQKCLAVCDRQCLKAWGTHGRSDKGTDGDGLPTILYFGRDEDDFDDTVMLADSEVGIAPQDPGTYEGDEGKPEFPTYHNKWCVRECERSNIIEPGQRITYPDFSKRQYNMPSNHPEAEVPQDFDTGEIFTKNTVASVRPLGVAVRLIVNIDGVEYVQENIANPATAETVFANLEIEAGDIVTRIELLDADGNVIRTGEA